MQLAYKILTLSRLKKRTVIFFIDLILANLIVLLITLFFFHKDNIFISNNLLFFLFFSNSFIPIFFIFRVYNIIFRYYGFQSFLKFIILAFLNYSLQALFIFYLNLDSFFYFLIFLKLILFSLFYNFFRLFISYFINNFVFAKNNKKTCLIYGTDRNSYEIYNQLNDFLIFGFIDDDNSMVGSSIDNKKIYNIDQAKIIIKERSISYIIVTFKNLSIKKKKNIFREFGELNIRIKFLPSVNDIIKLNHNEFQFNDILDRKIFVDYDKIKKNISNKVILVTGAGGSIGSELVRQLLDQKPRTILLLDNNEYSLYKIENEILNSILENDYSMNIQTILINIQNYGSLKILFEKFKPDIIFHAAAYKHVPMLETNIIEAIQNNVFGTLNIIKLSAIFNTSQFVLISTDKAVRPTNIMGVSKRISEITAKIYNAKSSKTIYSIIRFGNVIGSNGSVIPLFNYQIQKGGPLTLTHTEITRYFMLIPEAVGLVLQSAYLTMGGEVFVLKMGKPIKILDIALKMIKLHGFTIRDEANPNGDIEIKITGLRPGEKMHEELLIGNNPTNTAHPDIMMALEKIPNEKEFDSFLIELEKHCKNFDQDSIISLIKENIQGLEYYK